ncbi:hypothetical protein DSO57_1004373 [Entomophthora muscae]|uniref:Uncharacterized protein n=1 Tax=Entomophthora muscae TaxID=34485 RepID=A0ACC2U6Q3_9FUNG|nr:hypothetical protein DSO57_1004373 [Entomophthora muscae]
MWYPPEACSSDAMGFAVCCLKHFCELAYQSKVSLPAFYSYMEDVLLDCLTIGSSFSACGSWGRLCHMLVALAYACNQMKNNKYKLVAPLVHLLAAKHPHSTPSCCSIPHFPVDSAFSADVLRKNTGNVSSSSGSERCPSA